jgi:hypothetical protein
MSKNKVLNKTTAIILMILLTLSILNAINIMPVSISMSSANAATSSMPTQGVKKKSPEKLTEIPPLFKERLGTLLAQIEEVKAGDNYARGERIVVFKPSVSRERVDKAIAKANAKSVKDVAKYGSRGAEKVVKLLKFEDEDKARKAEASLKDDPSVL